VQATVTVTGQAALSVTVMGTLPAPLLSPVSGHRLHQRSRHWWKRI
jgi:hypothetical protein